MTYAKLNLNEWNAVTERARSLWLKRIGKRPRRLQDVEREPFNPINAAAFALLIFIIFFTGFKAMLAAVPVASSMYNHLLHSIPVDGLWLVPSQHLFISVMQLMFFIMTELGLIYFMLLKPQKPHITSITDYLHIRTITAYLPQVAVWGIVLFVVQISNTPEATLLDRYLPIVIGMGLAVYVEDVLEKRQARNAHMQSILRNMQIAYDNRVASMRRDPEYLLVLSECIWEAILSVKRTSLKNGRKERVNAHLETSDSKAEIVLAEYRRNTTTSLELSEEVENTDNKRVPPNGANEWTRDTFLADLAALGVTSPTQKFVRETYAKGYGAQTIYRQTFS